MAKKQSTPEKQAAETSFEELGLSSKMLKALEKAGYSAPTPIQAGLIPLALDELDVVGQARTGTGKTAAFAIPIIEDLAPRKEIPGPQALVLVPTRELAVQVHGEFEKLSYGRKTRSVAVYGGKPIRGQIEKLRAGVQVVVGTPGRVIDVIGRGALDLRDLWCVVLDEADRMLDIGFRPDIEKILRRCPKDRQTLLLSATVPPPIERLAKRYMVNPEKLDFSPGDATVDTIDQYYFTVDTELKFDLLLRLIEREEPKQAIVFCRTKRRTDQVARRLGKKLKGVGAIHSDLTQGARDRTMKNFREGKTRFLVATDVVGRGIDVSGISHIINFDIPKFCDDYVHRVGRTGRMGRDGVAFTFVAPEEGSELTRIEDRIDRLLKRDEMDNMQLVRQRSSERADGEKREPPPSSRRRSKDRYRRRL